MSKLKAFFTGVATLFNLGGVTPELYGEQMKPLVQWKYYVNDMEISPETFDWLRLCYLDNRTTMTHCRHGGTITIVSKIFIKNFPEKLETNR